MTGDGTLLHRLPSRANADNPFHDLVYKAALHAPANHLSRGCRQPQDVLASIAIIVAYRLHAPIGERHAIEELRCCDVGSVHVPHDRRAIRVTPEQILATIAIEVA